MRRSSNPRDAFRFDVHTHEQEVGLSRSSRPAFRNTPCSCPGCQKLVDRLQARPGLVRPSGSDSPERPRGGHGPAGSRTVLAARQPLTCSDTDWLATRRRPTAATFMLTCLMIASPRFTTNGSLAPRLIVPHARSVSLSLVRQRPWLQRLDRAVLIVDLVQIIRDQLR